MAAEQGAITKQLFYTLKLRFVRRWIVEFKLKTYGVATVSAVLTDFGGFWAFSNEKPVRGVYVCNVVVSHV